MPGAYQQQLSSRPIRDEFKRLLESQWTRKIACQNECGSDESCSCQRKIVHVHDLEAWWKKRASESADTKLERYIHESPVPSHLSLPVKPTRISKGGQSCFRILSLLLEQGREHLIDRFYEADMFDDFLSRSENDQNLRDQLAAVVHHDEVEAIIGGFHEDKWKYCPLPLTLFMNRNLHGTKMLPPFCLKTRLNDKGGTASIYWVAVQKDLISDNALALALQDSVFTDEEFGECYQMVLKSYCGNKKRDFELEKEAFSGLLQSSNEVPILQYLGSYTHDYGEGKSQGKTYNLLLEYGDNDLYQAWADETNVPPVQAQEILQTWKSLFTVAEAIRHVHHLEILRGKEQPRRFHGWHADIKPDNILSVHGRLKLADFGFSRFAPVLDGHEGSVPTELIRGFTDTYGAPEVSRMKHPDGTMSGVSQSIDAWSFGCVLSVAATWIVLGFQGVRQYDRLRQLSPANKKNGQELDRFHDGYHVLPEVGKWHDYLRGHLRPSDTTTDQVLDVIEGKLLRADPAARYSLGELCEKLQEVSDWAEFKIKSLKKSSRDTDPLVMKALSSIEDEAQVQRSSETKLNLLQPSFLQVNPRERASMQVNKEVMIRNKPLGQTAHRKQILERKLENCNGQQMDDGPPLMNAEHNGAVTESPIASTPSEDVQFGGRRNKPRNPQPQAHGQRQSHMSPHTPTGARPFLESNHPATPPSSSRRDKVSGPSTGPYNDDVFTTRPDGSPFDIGPFARDYPAKLNLQIPGTVSPSAKYAINLAQPSGISNLLSPFADKEYAMQNSNPLAEKETYAAESPPPRPIHVSIERDVEESNAPPLHNPVHSQSHKGKAPVVSDMSHTNSPFDDRHIHELNAGTASLVEPVGNPGPFITVSQPGDAQSPQQPASSESITHTQQNQAPRIHAPSKSYDDYPRHLPPSALDLPYDICLKRKDIDHQVSKGLAKGIAKVKGRFGIETRARAASLVETFSDPREIIFIVDNGWTMSKHWPIVTFVAQTLAKNAAGLDRSGFDVKFTIDGNTHNEQCLKGDLGRTKLKKALRAAWPEYKPNNHATTDMAKVLDTIFDEWRRAGQPATTLLVLTDGVWSNTNSDTLNNTILDIARLDQRHAGNRHFSIQFIRFGEAASEIARLQTLDDRLCADNNLRDIIDHCSWRAEVDKMFKGSIEGYLDEQDSVEEPMLYDYDKLVALFNAFNNGKEGALSPTSSLFRTPSRGSNRSSVSMSHANDWAKKG